MKIFNHVLANTIITLTYLMPLSAEEELPPCDRQAVGTVWSTYIDATYIEGCESTTCSGHRVSSGSVRKGLEGTVYDRCEYSLQTGSYGWRHLCDIITDWDSDGTGGNGEDNSHRTACVAQAGAPCCDNPAHRPVVSTPRQRSHTFIVGTNCEELGLTPGVGIEATSQLEMNASEETSLETVDPLLLELSQRFKQQKAEVAASEAKSDEVLLAYLRQLVPVAEFAKTNARSSTNSIQQAPSQTQFCSFETRRETEQSPISNKF